MVGKVTRGLVSHWPCVTDFSYLSTYGLNGLQDGDEHPSKENGTTFFTFAKSALTEITIFPYIITIRGTGEDWLQLGIERVQACTR